MGFSIIVAADEELGIGRAGGLPWHVPADLKHFARLTRGATLIVGTRTRDSLPPLPDRVVIPVGSREECKSLTSALRRAGSRPVFVAGGARLYAAALEHPECERIYFTEIAGTHGADVFFPRMDPEVYELAEAGEWKTSPPSSTRFRFCVWRRRDPHPEQMYVDLVRRILGSRLRDNRTGVRTYSVFGAHLRYDLRVGFPVLTTKRVWFRGVAEELLWFLRGHTDARILAAKGVHIWDGNTSAETLSRLGLDYPEGQAGPIYGYQWRNWGGDQLREAVRLLREDPHSRRILISAWNVVDIPRMVLPPCHVLMQFYVDEEGLRCQVYQRSADVGLGLPFNIASYALLTHIMAALCGRQAREVLFALGDCHIYEPHAAALAEQIERPTHPLPTLETPAITWESLETLRGEDFRLRGYKHGPSVLLEMAV